MEILDQFWAELLSGDPIKIRNAWDSLADDERAAVREHLQRMQAEAGWQPSQCESAVAALQVIQSLEIPS